VYPFTWEKRWNMKNTLRNTEKDAKNDPREIMKKDFLYCILLRRRMDR
jgi:hypothetical protein